MNVKNMTAYQLARRLNKDYGTRTHAAVELAERIESQEKPRCCLPKKKQRQLGLLPPVCPNE